ncbi:MAG: hypothetical protein JO057_25715 [Chloroflexi bacterium]|nr:hypothetical protein [Chloroflexota bacterium]
MRRRQPTYSQAQTVAAAEVGTDAASGAPLLAQVNYGPYAEGRRLPWSRLPRGPR